ncbi:MAG: peptide chain release factor 1 [Bacillota bacterium]|uniref:Peptide chain release factor 1 n=1 Tax=Thermanaerosceptrum fracticalcis TaxID=1712410 RepID=A0A7G6E4R7_THEFR|nr:peptide chain release factor 1 [Thermanaerosceptrum fracticalcis]QNB47071.1 peptide chain release factor 1 [Thermanaerosceptrum fracticalcis]
MLEKLEHLEERYEELSRLLSDPEVISNQSEWQKHAKAHAALTEVVSTFREYKDVVKNIAGNKELLEDKLEPDFRELVEAELEELKEKKEDLEKRLKILLLPKDPNDEKNVIMEIRGGTGGEEAALFAGDLLKMYSRYAEKQGWKTEMLSANLTDIGGIKEAIIMIEGRGAYSRLKFESGVHRVQRVPETESGGRIHTSAATVAVLPEAEEVDVQINPNDIRIDIFCSSGPGGQSVNTTQSAVRITHIPTGLVVSCQDEKSQHKNKDKAMKVLRARLLEKAQEEQMGEMASARKTMVGSGDRSERIRTYNFPQGRVTDHRINLTSYRLEDVLQGELDEFIDALITTDQAEKLKKVE